MGVLVPSRLEDTGMLRQLDRPLSRPPLVERRVSLLHSGVLDVGLESNCVFGVTRI